MRSSEAPAVPIATPTLAVTWLVAIDSELAISSFATLARSASPSARAGSAASSGPTTTIRPLP
jgi:hypothetical protein